MLARIIIGSIISLVGVLMVYKANWILDNFGRSDWAEEKLSGGSRSFYKLVGLGIIVVGFLIITNLIYGILMAFANLLIGKKN